MPKSIETGGINGAIGRGEWASYGIMKRNDLLMKTFGKVNLQSGKYNDGPGLELAINELKLFKAQHGRLPKACDKEMGGIIGAIYRKEWVIFGIKKWNDLLMKTFGEVNTEKRIYICKQGLDRAIAELLAFKVKHGRLPKTKDKEMFGIRGAIIRGEWVSFGIKKWSDLLKKTFNLLDDVPFRHKEFVNQHETLNLKSKSGA